MLIVEGTDGVGKTTLCKKLADYLPGYIYAHFTVLPDQFDHYWDYIDRMSRKVVQDRFHMSEIAYAIACNRKAHLDKESYRLIDAELRLLGGYTVLVIADKELVCARWDESQMYDRTITMRAGEVFTAIAIDEFDWIDVDQVVRLTQEHPYADQADIDRIFAGYQARQRAVLAIAERRRPALRHR